MARKPKPAPIKSALLRSIADGHARSPLFIADEVVFAEPAKQQLGDELTPGRFYTLTAAGGCNQLEDYLFELLAVNATHAFVRCLNPNEILPAKPFLIRRKDFEFADATDIVAAAAQFGLPTVLQDDDADSAPPGTVRATPTG